jgi:hypothetical protein
MKSSTKKGIATFISVPSFKNPFDTDLSAEEEVNSINESNHETETNDFGGPSAFNPYKN